LVKKRIVFIFEKEKKCGFQRSPYIKFKAIEFKSYIIVTSQCMKKILGLPHPFCFVYKQVNAQPYLKQLL
jgi:hypothetical protein